MSPHTVMETCDICLFLRLEGHNLSLDDEIHTATIISLQGEIKWRLSSRISHLFGLLADMCMCLRSVLQNRQNVSGQQQ
jgi:hypothetical protein